MTYLNNEWRDKRNQLTHSLFNKDPNAVKYDSIHYLEVINQGLEAMDTTAITLCMDNSIPIIVFGLNQENSIKKAITGESFGTIIK